VADDVECAICLDALSARECLQLPRGHVYHQSCVKGLRKFGANDACPEYRARLPTGPAATYDAAARLVVAAEVAKDALQRRRFAEAVVLLRQALAEDSSQAGYHCVLGSALHSQADIDGAEEAFGAAICIDPKHAVPPFNLGILLQYHRQGIDGAEVACQRTRRPRAAAGAAGRPRWRRGGLAPRTGHRPSQRERAGVPSCSVEGPSAAPRNAAAQSNLCAAAPCDRAEGTATRKERDEEAKEAKEAAAQKAMAELLLEEEEEEQEQEQGGRARAVGGGGGGSGGGGGGGRKSGGKVKQKGKQKGELKGSRASSGGHAAAALAAVAPGGAAAHASTSPGSPAPTPAPAPAPTPVPAVRVAALEQFSGL
jgi:hypothetical protein